MVDTGGDDAQALDDVCDVDNDADGVQDETGAVEEEVRLGRLVQLDEEAQVADGDGDVQDARDQRRRRVHEA